MTGAPATARNAYLRLAFAMAFLLALALEAPRVSIAASAASGGPAMPAEGGSESTTHRRLDELIDKKEPGIELVRSWIRAATNPVEELRVERADGERALVALQVTSRSPMGAIALETGGLLVDHGWIRVLGA